VQVDLGGGGRCGDIDLWQAAVAVDYLDNSGDCEATIQIGNAGWVIHGSQDFIRQRSLPMNGAV
jgi:hypothetical protein